MLVLVWAKCTLCFRVFAQTCQGLLDVVKGRHLDTISTIHIHQCCSIVRDCVASTSNHQPLDAADPKVPLQVPLQHLQGGAHRARVHAMLPSVLQGVPRDQVRRRGATDCSARPLRTRKLRKPCPVCSKELADCMEGATFQVSPLLEKQCYI